MFSQVNIECSNREELGLEVAIGWCHDDTGDWSSERLFTENGGFVDSCKLDWTSFKGAGCWGKERKGAELWDWL